MALIKSLILLKTHSHAEMAPDSGPSGKSPSRSDADWVAAAAGAYAWPPKGLALSPVS